MSFHLCVDVEPCSSDWDVLATYEYSKMVEGKSFVATVYNIDWSTDHDGQEKPTLRLSLCDTSHDIDVYIDQVLVQKNFAKFVNKD